MHQSTLQLAGKLPEPVSQSMIPDPIETMFSSLSNVTDPRHMKTAMYLVYKTVEANKNITINQLVFLLKEHYLLHESVTKGALAALITPTAHGAVSRFQRQGESLESSHLHVKEAGKQTDKFRSWLNNTLLICPELRYLVPPLLKRKQ